MAARNRGVLARALETVRMEQSKDGTMEASPAHYRRLGGLLFVQPYLFEFCAHVKQRWQGRQISDVLTNEFAARDRAYYEEACTDGRILIGTQSSQSGLKRPRSLTSPPEGGGTHILKNGEVIYHYVHRHEPPSLDTPVRLIAVRDDVVAACKPASVPVHAAGQYRRNTALVRLSSENPGIGALYPVHRLDKQVSGVLLFARSNATACALTALIQKGAVRKEYIARVRGTPQSLVDWIDGNTSSTATLSGVRLGDVPTLNIPKLSHLQDTRWLLVTAPLAHDPSALRTVALDTHDAALSAEATGKARQLWTAQTLVRPWNGGDGKPITFADGTFLVHVQPVTGRTHQIRAHLQHAGLPIANDVTYGGEFLNRKQIDPGVFQTAHRALRDALHGECFGDAWKSLHKAGNLLPVNDDEEAARKKNRKKKPAVPPRVDNNEDPDGPGSCAAGVDDDDWCIEESGEVAAWIRCPSCPFSRPDGFDMSELEALFLHAYRYSHESWSFEAELPEWATTS